MKFKLIMSAVLFLSFCPMIFPQEVNNDLTHNMNAVNFYIINGYAISYKFKNNSDIKYRINLDLSSQFSKSNNDGNNSYTYPTSSNDRDVNGDGKNSNFSISILPQLYYSILKNNFGNLYVGTGPILSYHYNKYSSHSLTTEKPTEVKTTQDSYNKTNSYSVGISAFAGLESYITRNISFFGEMFLSGGRNWSSTKGSSVAKYQDGFSNYDYNSKDNSWFSELSNIRIGVSLYF